MAVLWENERIRKSAISVVQINLGDRCNQSCSHCHLGASPRGKKNMETATAGHILRKLLETDVGEIEFTGGAPELNPSLRVFIEELGGRGKRTVVRTNLTVLDMPEHGSLIDIYKRCGTKVIASLPSCFRETTDGQRGKGVFDASVSVLNKLNRNGYGVDSRLVLDLVYNPEGGYLPPSPSDLERDYKKLLKERHGISFNNLITITNSPIGGFKRYLVRRGSFDEYMKLLVNNFNPETLNSIMCRRLLSVDYRGNVYDCDFNLALGMRIKGYEDRRFWEIDFDDFEPEITCGEHCYACTVTRGSSCHGALIKDEAEFDVKESVRDYYGRELRSSADLKTTACCTPDALPGHVREVMPYIADEIKAKYYGCGSPIPLRIEGLSVLDLGCGTGRDSYVLSKLVGEKGFVYGLDMTGQQIEVARKHREDQARRFGYTEPNTEFIFDCIENAGQHFGRETLDLVISNCVINLVEDKERAIGQIYEMLKYGGEFHFSDIYADRRLPEHIRKDPVLYGECLGGALYYRDFERMARRAGFADPRMMSKRTVAITNDEVKKLTGNITFFSITYRLWKLEGLDDACEDYGHIAIYRGGISESPFAFELDGSHIFEKDRPERVCGNTALMLSRTRFEEFFDVRGDFTQHFGEFAACGTSLSSSQRGMEQAGGACC
ncbi:MAG: arsenosugar biosynthesis radical SAM (seleno)protein ArsS [Nitrospirota bacterium]